MNYIANFLFECVSDGILKIGQCLMNLCSKFGGLLL